MPRTQPISILITRKDDGTISGNKNEKKKQISWDKIEIECEKHDTARSNWLKVFDEKIDHTLSEKALGDMMEYWDGIITPAYDSNNEDDKEFVTKAFKFFNRYPSLCPEILVPLSPTLNALSALFNKYLTKPIIEVLGPVASIRAMRQHILAVIECAEDEIGVDCHRIKRSIEILRQEKECQSNNVVHVNVIDTILEKTGDLTEALQCLELKNIQRRSNQISDSEEKEECDFHEDKFKFDIEGLVEKIKKIIGDRIKEEKGVTWWPQGEALQYLLGGRIRPFVYPEETDSDVTLRIRKAFTIIEAQKFRLEKLRVKDTPRINILNKTLEQIESAATDFRLSYLQNGNTITPEAKHTYLAAVRRTVKKNIIDNESLNVHRHGATWWIKGVLNVLLLLSAPSLFFVVTKRLTTGYWTFQMGTEAHTQATEAYQELSKPPSPPKAAKKP